MSLPPYQISLGRGAPPTRLGSRSRLRTLLRPTLHPGSPGGAPGRSPRTGLVLWDPLPRARLPSEDAEKWDAPGHRGPIPGAPSLPQLLRGRTASRTRPRRAPPRVALAAYPSAYPLRPRRCEPLARPPDPASSHRVSSHHRRPPHLCRDLSRAPGAARPPAAPGPSPGPRPSAPALPPPLPAPAAPPRSPPQRLPRQAPFPLGPPPVWSEVRPLPVPVLRELRIPTSALATATAPGLPGPHG